ncbi:aminopeptidase [Patescibacteria group bacterium]|nr:aminopeptidase [Patescibacteria group bacterium]
MKTYTPSKKILEKYADVMVNYALNSGKGIKKGEVVQLTANEASKPLYAAIYREILKQGGHVIGNFGISEPQYDTSKIFFEEADVKQIQFFPEAYYKGLLEVVDHSIYIISEEDPELMKNVDPKKIMQRGEALKPWREWRTKKENRGEFSWTLCLYGTEAMAKAAGLSIKEYWNQIIKACYLNDKDPVVTWKKLNSNIQKNVHKLNTLKIQKLHIVGADVDLHITLPKKGAWKGGSGANIPSFEIFTSPDWRGTNGWIRFNQPLYRYGNIIKGIKLEFKNGRVVKSSATKNEKVLKEMIATKNADKIGEFSLTDARFSKITKPMADTLYDENMGGKYGNTHIALGMAYRDCYQGDPGKVTEKEWEKMGYNFSSVHTDIVSTTDRTVTATLADGTEKVIYKKGQFTI